MSTVKTPIDGLKIKLNKVIGDKRGYLYEIAPGGNDNELIQGKIGNIYCSSATKKGVARGGHYHHKLIESFCVVQGTALWLFKDFRKSSKTYGKTYALILGEKTKKVSKLKLPSYFLTEVSAQALVPSGVYHVYYPLTNRKVIVIAITNLPHDSSDYVRFAPEEDRDLKKILEELHLIKA